MLRFCAVFVSALLLGAPLFAGQPVGELVGWQTARFFVSEEAASRGHTSLAFSRIPRAQGEVPGDFPFKPQWQRRDGITTITIAIPEGSSLYGLGRAPGGLVRRGSFRAEAAPWVLGVRDDGSGFGFFVDTLWAASFDLAADRVRIETGDPEPVLIVFGQGEPMHVVIGLLSSAGPMEIPPLWALGIHVAAPALERSGGGAAEAVYFECELAAKVAEGMCFGRAADSPEEHPVVKRRVAVGRITVDAALVAVGEEDDRSDASPRWVKDEDGEVLKLEGRVLPDFTDPATRAWWGGHIAALAERSADGVAVFESLLDRVPESARVSGDPEHGGGGTMQQYRGAFEYLALRATWDGYDPFERNRRPLFAFPGSAIGSTRWGGHLMDAGPETTSRELIARALNSALSAQPMVGALLPELQPEEWAQLLGAAGMMPLVHIAGMPDDESAQELLAALAAQRRQLLPYIYTLVFHAMYQAQPILQPLWVLDPTDVKLRDIDTAYLLGNDLLVVPPMGEETFDADLLDGTWRRLRLGNDDQRLPALYMRPGSIIPLAPEGMSVADWLLDPITIIASLDQEGHATGVLYEDDWNDYQLFDGNVSRITYDVRQEGETAFVRLMGLDGGRPLPQRRLAVRIVTDDGEFTAVGSERGTIRIPLGE